jgi:membrane protein YqaA with SNARE-associated domain
MRLFGPLYKRAMEWARHPSAPRYLAALSFAESSFFPIPPDVMLIPMSAAEPRKGLRFALITTLASVVGGVFGYLIGMFALDAMAPWLQTTHYWARYLEVRHWFDQWGVWLVLVAGFSPIPYKLFTLSAGALSLAFLPFVLASAIGRGARFFLVAALVSWLGPRVEPVVRRYIEWLGWATVVLLGAVILWYRLRG